VPGGLQKPSHMYRMYIYSLDAISVLSHACGLFALGLAPRLVSYIQLLSFVYLTVFALLLLSISVHLRRLFCNNEAFRACSAGGSIASDHARYGPSQSLHCLHCLHCLSLSALSALSTLSTHLSFSSNTDADS
jgi:hypothetical protein